MAALGASALALGCRAGDPGGFPIVAMPGTLVRSAKPYTPAPKIAEADAEALAEGNREFACALYRELATGEGNLVFSPHSVSVAMAMAYAGARGETAKQLADVLHFTLPQERLHPAFGALDWSLRRPGEEPDRRLVLNELNAVWTGRGWTFLEPFLDTLSVNYDTGMRELDFAGDAEGARRAINQWVKKATEGRIGELVTKGDFSDLTALVLTNAVYFRAHWAQEFEKRETKKQPFHRLTGGDVRCEMMHQSTYTGSFRGEGFDAVRLPYFGGRQSMVAVLPDEGSFAAVEAALDAEMVSDILGNPQKGSVEVGLPKFRFEGGADLARVLAEMGAPDAFDLGAADFSGMTGKRDLFISHVRHKAFVSVNEKWTEAGAATAAQADLDAAALRRPARVILDRPFLFLIVDEDSGAVLFLGRVMDPTA